MNKGENSVFYTIGTYIQKENNKQKKHAVKPTHEIQYQTFANYQKSYWYWYW